MFSHKSCAIFPKINYWPIKSIAIPFDTWQFGCNTFSPECIWSPNFRSPTFCHPRQMIPINFIPLDKRSTSNSVPMEKWSQKIWSSWTNVSKSIWSPYFWIPTACPPEQMEYSRDHLSRGTKLVVDHLSRGTELFGTICPWGLNWVGTVCPEGQIDWGPIEGHQMHFWPNVSQPHFGKISALVNIISQKFKFCTIALFFWGGGQFL